MHTPRILLAYHSAEGQTKKVADRLALTLREAGASVDEVVVEDAPSPRGHDGVILGDSIHAGRHSRALARYLAKHADELHGMPFALFQVSLTSAKQDEDSVTEAHALLQRLLDSGGVEPDVVGLFAGAIAYTHYGWLKRHLMRRIAASQGGDTDTSKDFEYTDWDAVDHFARDALAIVRSARQDAGA